MEIQKVKMFINYPLLVPLNDKCTTYEGYLTIKEKDFRIHLDVPNFPSTLGLLFSTDPLLQSYSEIKQLIGIKPILITEFLEKVCIILSHEVKPCLVDQDELTFVQQILTEYQVLEQNKNILKIKINKSINSIKIQIRDDNYRDHFLKISITDKYFKLDKHYIPQSNPQSEVIKPNKSLVLLVEKFCALIYNLQEYYDVMDSIDELCWVLDPKKPTRRDFIRRIVIDKNVSIQVTFDPWNVRNRPQIQFLGSERATAVFRQKLVDNIENWDVNYDIPQNILRLLDLTFFPREPIKVNQSEDMVYETGECCICFSLRLNDLLPDQICDNEKCEQAFHTDCLYQWLNSISTSHKSLKTIHGECPNCKSGICCPIPQ